MKKKKLINCKSCGKEIATSAKVCPGCGAKNKKPFYKTVWFWSIIFSVIVLEGIGISARSIYSDNQNKYDKNKDVKVTVVDFSTMTEVEIDTWCDNNKINCTIKKEHSDTVAENAFISQSIAPDKSIYEGENIIIIYSLGKEVSTEHKNALRKAQLYSDTMHMSKQKIYDQLVSEYGENFEPEAAQYAIDHIQADWNANALAKAKSYRDIMYMSKQRIYDQLISEYGEKFTREQAQYAIDHLDD